MTKTTNGSFVGEARTNMERVQSMPIDELAKFLLNVNSAYAAECMIEEGLCKHPNTEDGCLICFKEWLKSKADQGKGQKA